PTPVRIYLLPYTTLFRSQEQRGVRLRSSRAATLRRRRALRGYPPAGMNLLQELVDLQERHGWLSEETLRKYSEDTGTPLYQLQRSEEHTSELQSRVDIVC